MMAARTMCVVTLLAIAACHGASSTPAPAPPAPATPPPARSGATTSGNVTVVPATRDVFVATGASFRPVRGDSALRAFVPEVAAQESGGECSVTRTGGSGATMVMASFPARTKALMQVNITFDSSGRLVRYSERRGVPDMSATKGVRFEQIDSLIRAQEAKTRTTSVSLDYAIDQGIAMNRGGDRPTIAVMGTVREIERMEKLGPPTARLERVRKLCGV